MLAQESRFPVVGIGASAGGIEALELLFRSMPVDTGAAFVIVTHLSPERESVLPEILSRFTSMPVETIQDGMAVRPNVVFVLPENAILEIEDGRFQLRRPDPVKRERKPVDIFLSALALDQGEYAVGIILSGGDADGTIGIKAIKEYGGLTLAQTADHSAPRHSSMPQNAIATGLIDFAVAVQEMPKALVDFVRSLFKFESDSAAVKSLEDVRANIYGLLRNQVGHDFSGYKTRTFNRRVQRRMQVNQVDRAEAYVELLRREPSEVSALFRDLLISVTTFFRDTEAFEALKTNVIPKLFEGRGADATVRIWVPACATGEEVYSIAILVRECLEGLRNQPRVQIFATDIDDRSLTIARAARYPTAMLDSVSQERRERFFVPDGAMFVLSREVRDLCIFSPHSIIRDPPFSRMDLISCRNLLIYFGQEIQSQVFPIFYYSLRAPNGFLFLGTSENISQFSDLFVAVDKKNRIFQAREGMRNGLRMPLTLSGPRAAAFPDASKIGEITHQVSLRQTIESHVVEQFGPPHVVVNSDGDIVHYSSHTGKYLEAAIGAPTRQLLAVARKGLRLDLRTALREATEGHVRVVRANVAIEIGEGLAQIVNLIVDPIAGTANGHALFIVLFIDDGPALPKADMSAHARGDNDETFQHLERDLRDTRERLQSMIEEYETALEELKSSHEELVSVNEELQSSNEELESSKEELHSLNEELQTINLELGHKIDALEHSNSDLRNLFESTQIAMIFLDNDLIIRNFTPPAERFFNFVPGDRGRKITTFSCALTYSSLMADLQKTIRTGNEHEYLADHSVDLSQFLVRLQPYTGLSGDTQGAIITFIDVSTLKAASSATNSL